MDGPNLYADVQQNPWTSYDPDGLLAFQVHNPHAGWNPDIRAITSSPEYQKVYWETAQTGALALAAAPLVVAAAYSGLAVAAVIAKEAVSEAASAGFEAATGLPTPPISVKDIGEKLIKEGSKKLVKEGGEKAVKESLEKATKETTGTRRKNRLPDQGEPNTTAWNEPGTTAKKYGPDGKTQKEFNRGHQGDNTPEVEKSDHIHDYKQNPNHPNKIPTRQPGRNVRNKDYREFGNPKRNSSK